MTAFRPLLCNVIDALHYDSEEVRRGYLESGFLCIEQTEHDTIEGTLHQIESYFALT